MVAGAVTKSEKETSPGLPVTSPYGGQPNMGEALIYKVIRRLISEGILMGHPRSWPQDIITETVRVQYPVLSQILNDRNSQR